MLVWIITIVISYITFIIAFKIDDKCNCSAFRNNIDDLWIVTLILMAVPFVNIIVSLLVLIGILVTVALNAIEKRGMDSEGLFKKIFFIKEKK